MHNTHMGANQLMIEGDKLETLLIYTYNICIIKKYHCWFSAAASPSILVISLLVVIVLVESSMQK
jgi:hypothetical protein